MTEKFQLYKCEICGNLVEVLIAGAGELVCCGQPMNLLTAHTEEEIKGESHLPFMYHNEEGKELVRIGEKFHPMIPEHYIQFIELISENGKISVTKFFEPEEVPEISLNEEFGDYIARENCNIHGLWSTIIQHD